MHRGGAGEEDLEGASYFYYVLSTVLTFVLPVILLFIPWWALLVQACGCCTRKLGSSEFWLSIITLFLVLFYEASRAPYELFNIHHIMTNWKVESGLVPLDLEPFIPGKQAFLSQRTLFVMYRVSLQVVDLTYVDIKVGSSSLAFDKYQYLTTSHSQLNTHRVLHPVSDVHTQSGPLGQ